MESSTERNLRVSTELTGSIIDPVYSSGKYFSLAHENNDARYKIHQLSRILSANAEFLPAKLNRAADIGCGLGQTTYLFRDLLFKMGFDQVHVEGYDVHPQVSSFVGDESVHFIQGDFCLMAANLYDMVILFDVIEHIPDPIGFLRLVGQRARLIALHIPLDNSLLSGVRNLYRPNLKHPGHLVALDTPAALNLLAFSGLRVIDFAYSPAFTAPSSAETNLQRVANPLRGVLYRLNPYVSQKLLGGVSLMVLACSPLGLGLEKQ